VQDQCQLDDRKEEQREQAAYQDKIDHSRALLTECGLLRDELRGAPAADSIDISGKYVSPTAVQSAASDPTAGGPVHGLASDLVHCLIEHGFQRRTGEGQQRCHENRGHEGDHDPVKNI
jgi:hypothetical protein